MLSSMVIAPGAHAAPDHWVSADDPIMACSGDKVTVGCETDDFDPKYPATNGELPAVKVTDKIAGCLPGGRSSVGWSNNYTQGTSVSVGGGISLNLLPGSEKLLKGLGAGEGVGSISADGSVTWTKSTGDTQNFTVGEKYGYLSEGRARQQTKIVRGDMFVSTSIPDGEGPNVDLQFGAHDVIVETPQTYANTNIPIVRFFTKHTKIQTKQGWDKNCSGYPYPSWIK